MEILKLKENIMVVVHSQEEEAHEVNVVDLNLGSESQEITLEDRDLVALLQKSMKVAEEIRNH